MELKTTKDGYQCKINAYQTYIWRLVVLKMG